MSLTENITRSPDAESFQGDMNRESSSEYINDEKKNLEMTAAPPALTFPEGGLHGWLAVAGGFLTLFCAAGTMQSFGVYENYYTLNSLSEHPPSDIAWIRVCGFFSGQLFDLGYFRLLLSGGSFLFVFSSFMLSLVQPQHFYQNFLAQGLGMGIGMGMLFMPSLSIASHYFRRRRALAMGIMLAGGSLGAAIYPIMLNHLFPTVGFAWAVRAQSFLYLGLLVISNLIMKTRLPPGGKKSVDMKGIMTDVPYMICTAGSFFVFWGLFVPYFYLQLFCSKHNLPTNIVTYGITILNIMGVVGRTVPNFFADVFGPFNIAIFTAGLTGAFVFMLLASKSVAATVIFAILYGFTSGGFVSVIGPVAASFSKNINEVGTRMGFLTFVSSFAMLTGSPISGALLHAPQYYWLRPVVFSAVVVLFGCALITISRSMQAKKKGTWKL
ncbi:MFS general substrate transporter [Gymnopus androsaceus JB14]|uniref:MFS general substrate transporter n=1 Tax=Gymnopus androsaceus JB14 TaxID=1447944 RepID=A0A6A4I5T3_9AGAR|nr:MFS general substrate transporter [Gymnopus androsaceus JB14]